MGMNVSLTPQLEELVKRKVESGLYNSASEVLREALRLMEEQDRIRDFKIAELRKEIQSGLDSGEAKPFDLEDTIKRGYERYNKRTQQV
jgi:antitoxin ParD1/3/4